MGENRGWKNCQGGGSRGEITDFEGWLGHVFFAGLEISMLSIPTLVAALRGPVSMAALPRTIAGIESLASGLESA